MADTDKKGWLDRSRDYGQHYGDDQGRAFEQDGKHFNFDGSPWKPAGERSSETKAPRATAPTAPSAPPAPPADDQLSRQLKG